MNGILTEILAMTPGLDGVQAPFPYSPLVTLGLFVGIPLAVFALVILAVYGTSWTRSGRANGEHAEEPSWMSSPAASISPPATPGTELPAGSSDREPGGSGARW